MAFTPNINAPQGQTLVVFNKPASAINAVYAGATTVYNNIARNINVSQAVFFVVARGRIANPNLIAWSYTLDGHDFYILKLGSTGKTLVFDLTTQQWSWWSTFNSISLRTSYGFNWRSAATIPSVYGSNIIVGDDTLGTLWVLNPLQGLDDNPLDDTQSTFDRVATGQMIQRGRVSTPVYSAYLTASFGDPTLILNTVTLDYSDDQGNTYVTADQPQISLTGGYDQEFVWRSMGQVRAPGRLFRITDDGAFARIDGLDINANEGS